MWCCKRSSLGTMIASTFHDHAIHTEKDRDNDQKMAGLICEPRLRRSTAAQPRDLRSGPLTLLASLSSASYPMECVLAGQLGQPILLDLHDWPAQMSVSSCTPPARGRIRHKTLPQHYGRGATCLLWACFRGPSAQH